MLLLYVRLLMERVGMVVGVLTDRAWRQLFRTLLTHDTCHEVVDAENGDAVVVEGTRGRLVGGHA